MKHHNRAKLMQNFHSLDLVNLFLEGTWLVHEMMACDGTRVDQLLQSLQGIFLRGPYKLSRSKSRPKQICPLRTRLKNRGKRHGCCTVVAPFRSWAPPQMTPEAQHPSFSDRSIDCCLVTDFTIDVDTKREFLVATSRPLSPSLSRRATAPFTDPSLVLPASRLQVGLVGAIKGNNPPLWQVLLVVVNGCWKSMPAPVAV